MEPVRPWFRVCSVAVDGTVTASWAVEGQGRPDLSTIDQLARGALAATRRGERLVLHDVAPEMAELLELAALPVEVER